MAAQSVPLSRAVTRGFKADQAVFTSLPRRAIAGYHLVSRSSGLSDADAQAISTWAPSHGGLILDQWNRISLNYQVLPSQRLALSRSCEGPTEYSGRGKKQVYTHTLIFDREALQLSEYQPIAIYRAALALGYFRYRNEPESLMPQVVLPIVYPRRDPRGWQQKARDLRLPNIESAVISLSGTSTLKLAHGGDRILLAEYILSQLPPEWPLRGSFSTSLVPSMVRPYKLTLVDLGSGGGAMLS